MSYHIVSVDTPSVSLSCKRGQLTCRDLDAPNGDGDEAPKPRTIPLEDVAAIVITSFSANIHSKLLLEAAKHGVALILCDGFKPASLVLPADRSTDTNLTRAHLKLRKFDRDRLWKKTVDAKTANQLALARQLAPEHEQLPALERFAAGDHPQKEALAAREFWRIYGDALTGGEPFTRDRDSGGLNALLNYGYAVLLSTMLQKLFAIGLDPTFGIFHATREHSTPLAYDLMEPFRPWVDWSIARWVRREPAPKTWEVNKEFRAWVTRFPAEKAEGFEGRQQLLGNLIESVARSFRKAVLENKTGLYKPWTPKNSKWAG